MLWLFKQAYYVPQKASYFLQQAYYSLSPPGGSFLHYSSQHSEFCSNESVMQQTLLAMFWKKLVTYLWGGGDVGYPNFDLWGWFDKKWKNEKSDIIRGEQGGEMWTNATQIFFCICVAYLLVSESIFFDLGIHNEFVIANSFPCIFTSYRGINFDLVILQRSSEDTFLYMD